MILPQIQNYGEQTQRKPSLDSFSYNDLLLLGVFFFVLIVVDLIIMADSFSFIFLKGKHSKNAMTMMDNGR